MNRYPFSVFTVLRPHVASLGLVWLAHLFVATSHSIPHSRILRTRKNSPTIIIQCIIIHILQLISLTKTIPSSKIFWINFYCTSISLNSSRNILHLQILMTHKCPSCKTGSIQLQSFSKIDNSLEVLSHQRIVVTNYTASFRVIFIVIEWF